MSELTDELVRDLWVVKNIKYDLWWRPKACGYTNELVAAAVVDEHTAKGWVQGRPSEDRAMPLSEALQGLDNNTMLAVLLEKLEEAKNVAYELRDAWVPKHLHTEFPWEE